MSIKDKRILAIIGIGLLIGGSGEYFHQKIKNQRQPASEKGLKANPKNILAMGKQDRAISVELKNPNGTPEEDSQELTLRAEISVQQALPNNELFYTWTLPEGAQIVSGHLSDSLPNIQPGQIAVIEIVLTGVSREQAEKHVVFDAHYLVGDARIGNSAVFSTHRNDEDSRLPSPAQSALATKSSLPGELKAENAKMPKVHFKQ